MRSYSVVFPLERSPLSQKRGVLHQQIIQAKIVRRDKEPFSGFLTPKFFGRGKRFVEYFILKEKAAQHHVLIVQLMSEVIPHF